MKDSDDVFFARQRKLWIEHKLPVSFCVDRKQYYVRFRDRWKHVWPDKVDCVCEIGPGVCGGMIGQLELKADLKVFIDRAMTIVREAGYFKWPEENMLLVEQAIEDVEYNENCFDLLLSYNCLDHGWDLGKAIKNCIRMSKICIVSFDLRGEYYSDFDGEHQLIKKEFALECLNRNILSNVQVEHKIVYEENPYPIFEFCVRKNV